MKTCSKCHIEKDESGFYNPNGRTCKECHYKRTSEWKKNNIERVRAMEMVRMRKKRKENPEQFREIDRKRYYEKRKPEGYSKKKYWEHRDRKLAIAKKSAKKNKERRYEYLRKYKETNPEKVKQWKLKCAAEHKEKYREKSRKNEQKGIDSLSSAYLKKRLKYDGFSEEQIKEMPFLLNVKKLKIVKHRIKQHKKNKNYE